MEMILYPALGIALGLLTAFIVYIAIENSKRCKQIDKMIKLTDDIDKLLIRLQNHEKGIK